MINVARLPEIDRKDLFRASSQIMKIHEAVIEKDFWVCWVLDYLFRDSPWKSSLIFKGGTSLSKVYGLIERFSEDIDLILDWELLGYNKEEPWKERTTTQMDKFGKTANQRTEKFLAEIFTPQLRTALTARLNSEIAVLVHGPDILIQYPRTFPLDAILPQIKLEIGPLAERVPNDTKEIQSFAAEMFPQYFSQPSTFVQTLSAERSFWEKATILHQEAHRAPGKPLPPRFSRHYYDFYRMSRSTIRDSALARIDLLKDVVRFKMRFYRCPWAQYEDAKPGSLRISPPVYRLDDLRKDYRSMQAMLFGTIPQFEEIFDGIAALEKLINDTIRN